MPTRKVARLSYPEMPIPTGYISAETVAGVVSEVITELLPWHIVETVAGVLSSADVVTEVTIVAETVAGVQSDGVFIRDNIIAETVAGVLSEISIIPVGIIAAATTAGVTSEAIPVPSAIGGGETYAEVISMVEVTPVAVAIATSSAGVTSEAAMVPVAIVVAETVAGAISEGVITSFKPSGMVKSSDSNITSTTAALVTGMAANANLPGSTVTSDALVSVFAGQVRVGFSIQLSSSGGTTGNAAVFKNGVQVGDTFSMTVPYNGASLITGSATFTVATSDAVTIRYWSASASYPVSVKATTTRLNMSAGDTIALGGTVSANYTPGDGWTDMPIVADSGTTVSGNAIVVQAAHPNAIVTAAAVISSGSPMALRFLVNGVVVHTGPTAPAYDVRMVAATGLALAPGDLVKCQVQRISTFATTISAGATFKIV